jgi:hypothetical protein
MVVLRTVVCAILLYQFRTLSRKSDMAAAILYALKLWPVLRRHCYDGAVEIDN